MMTREKAEIKARKKWNREADEHNQWDMLGGDEQEELIESELKRETKCVGFKQK